MGRTLKGTDRQGGKRAEVNENEREIDQRLGGSDVEREMEGRRKQRK